MSTLNSRDHSKPAEAQGLFRKFNVTRVDGSDQPGGKHHGCEYFVLDVDHDPHAKAALQAYAVACALSHPQLSADLIVRHGAMPVGERKPLKIEFTKEWCMATAKLEEGCDVTAGVPVWEPLTESEIDNILDAAKIVALPPGYEDVDYEIARAIEAAHGITKKA